MQLIGVDPAPAKKSVVFDGERFSQFEADELKEYLESFGSDTLISWDAPLGDDFSQSLSYKPIERVLNSKSSYIDGKKPPRGISTLPFSGCPHWSISQYVLGYPIINKDIIDSSKLKFHQVFSKKDISKTKPNVIEAHPAFAMWVWLRDRVDFEDNWRYKGDKKAKEKFEVLKEALFELEFVKRYADIKSMIVDDDHLDSFLAYLLLDRFLVDEARIYGDRKMGVMLLPKLDDVLKKGILC